MYRIFDRALHNIEPKLAATDLMHGVLDAVVIARTIAKPQVQREAVDTPLSTNTPEELYREMIEESHMKLDRRRRLYKTKRPGVGNSAESDQELDESMDRPRPIAILRRTPVRPPPNESHLRLLSNLKSGSIIAETALEQEQRDVKLLAQRLLQEKIAAKNAAQKAEQERKLQESATSPHGQLHLRHPEKRAQQAYHYEAAEHVLGETLEQRREHNRLLLLRRLEQQREQEVLMQQQQQLMRQVPPHVPPPSSTHWNAVRQHVQMTRVVNAFRIPGPPSTPPPAFVISAAINSPPRLNRGPSSLSFDNAAQADRYAIDVSENAHATNPHDTPTPRYHESNEMLAVIDELFSHVLELEYGDNAGQDSQLTTQSALVAASVVFQRAGDSRDNQIMQKAVEFLLSRVDGVPKQVNRKLFLGLLHQAAEQVFISSA